MTYADRLETLHLLWSHWAAQGRALTEEQWRRSTRLEAWDARSLYAHAAGWPYGFSKLVDRVSDTEPTYESAADLLRELNRPDGAIRRDDKRIAALASQDATTYTTEQLVEQFASAGPKAIDRAQRLGNVVVDYGPAKMRLYEAVSIGVVEATVHLLDLHRALETTPDVPEAGLRHTVWVLSQMAPPVDFIEVATGRSPAPVFPVMT